VHQGAYFDVIDSGVIGEGLWILVSLVGHQGEVLAAVKEAMVTMTL